jgi:hypothetical protein
MPLELLLDRVQAVFDVLLLRMQPDEFSDQRGEFGVTQGCGSFFRARYGQTLHTAECAIAQHGLIAWYEAATASAGAIKLRRTLRTQARATLRVHGGTDRC